MVWSTDSGAVRLGTRESRAHHDHDMMHHHDYGSIVLAIHAQCNDVNLHDVHDW